MALFVDVSVGFPVDVEVDISGGVSPDTIGDTPSVDPSVVQVVYAPSLSGFGQDRLDAAVNSIGTSIVISGVDSSFLLNGMPMSSMGGATFVDGTIIRIIYDVTQCAGSNYFVLDGGGNHISCPNFIIVGHELSHAFHVAVGDSPPLGTPASEVQAETDENSYRSQYGLDLRDPNDHSLGCGFTPGGGGGGTTITCLIASAAFASSQAPQLNNARRLRDIVLRTSVWGAELFDRLHDEYYRFSPQVASRMNDVPEVREAISALVVDPFFEYLAILEAYAKLAAGAAESTEARIHAWVARLPAAGVTHEHAARIAAVLSGLKTRLRKDGHAESAVFDAHSGMSAMEILKRLCDTVEASVPAGGYVAWALLDPVILFWKAISQGSSGVQFLRGIDGWLNCTPIPSGYELLDEESLERDLRYLRTIWFTSPGTRRTVAERLMKTSDPGRSYDISGVLKRSGYGGLSN